MPEPPQSRAAAEPRAAAKPEPAPPIRLPRIRIPQISPRARRRAAVALAALLALAAAAYGLGALLGSSGSGPGGTGAASGPPAAMAWLGMEVETISPGRVVVATVSSGSEGERAGFEPGDVMIAIDSRSLVSARDITKAIFGMRSGDEVQIEVGRGSTVFVTSATLGAPPAKYP
jgi:S1-C subfamily serine protease